MSSGADNGPQEVPGTGEPGAHTQPEPAAAPAPAESAGAGEPPPDDDGGGSDGGGGGSADDATGGSDPERTTEKISSAFTDALVKGIAYLATGAGFLTFVGATGAAVTWMRLNAAELPATQALQLVGIKHLVADGAVALVVFAVLGLIAVTLIYVIDVPGRDTDEMRHGLTALALSESLIAVWMADRYVLDLPSLELAVGGVLALGLLTVGISLLPERTKPPPTRGPAMRWLRQNVGARIADLDPLPPPTNAQLRAEIERRRLLRQLGMPSEALPRKWKKSVKLLPMLGLVVATLIVGAAYANWYHDWVGWSIWLAWGLAGLCFGVARTTERFWPYGLAVFFSVALFGAWLNVVRLSDDPELSPAALLRTGNGGTAGVVGLYVARTDDRYWLGAVTMGCKGERGGALVPNRVKQGSGRIFSIPRSQVVDDTIGARTSLDKVGDEALKLLGEVVRRQPPGGSSPPGLPPSTTTTTPRATVAAERAPTRTTTVPATGGGGQEPAPTRGVTADSAAMPRTLAVTGRCMHPPPRLTRLSPATAAPGDQVEIIGSDLGAKPRGADRVTVNGKQAEAPPAFWQNRSVVFRVPDIGDQRAIIRVVARGHLSNPLVLQVR